MPQPCLPARDPNEAHRASTPFELLFDLISVIAIAAVTHGLAHAIAAGHGLAVLPNFLFLFVAVWWAWMNFTWFASAFDNDGFAYRLLVMVVMTGELIFAGGAGYIFETLDFSYGVWGWALMRLGMAALWLSAAQTPAYRTTCLRYAAGIVIAQILWIALWYFMAPGTGTFLALGCLIWLVEFAVPMLAEAKRPTPFHRHHIIERYGLLTIIAMGEIMLAISHGFGRVFEDHAALPPALTALAALVLTFAVFWIYFSAEEHLKSRTFPTVFLWGYGHVVIFAAIAALGAGITAEIDLAGRAHAPAAIEAPAHGAPAPEGHTAPEGHEAPAPEGHAAPAPETHAVPAEGHGAEHAPASAAWFLGGPLAVLFLGLWAVRDRLYPLGLRGPALPVMALVALAAAAFGLPSWAFAAIAALALIWRVPMPGRAAPAPMSH